jgi:hypothetical protein
VGVAANTINVSMQRPEIDQQCREAVIGRDMPIRQRTSMLDNGKISKMKCSN